MVERTADIDRVVPLDLPDVLPRKARRRLIRAMLLGSDAVMLLAATLAATFLRFTELADVGGFEHVLGGVTYFELSLVLTCVWMLTLWFERLYDLDRVSWGSGEFSRVARGLALGLVAFILVTFAVKVVDLSRLWLILGFGMALVLASGGRLGVRAALSHLRRHDHLLRPTLVVGSNAEADDLVRVLSADRSTGIRPVGCLASSRAERLALNFCASVPCLGAARDIVPIVREFEIDTVVIASSAFDHDVLARIVAELRGVDVDVQISSGLFEVLTNRMLVREISGVPLITVKGVSLSKANLRTKRAFDLVVATAIVLAGTPIWVLLATLIKVTSSGSVLYGQERIGKDGVPFGMLKFRSMVEDADVRLVELSDGNDADGPLFKMKDDPRVTSVGRWMRKFSVDEFPQLINVLRGEMSLVGPRPPLSHEVGRYTEQAWRRLDVLPGMTGLWQVSGRSNLTFDEMVRLDLFYIENWSVSLDLALMIRTIPAVLAARGAY
jgi:exopolysaccharide biosynthesis polyprenyl glycosylphosphotransferase